MTATSAARHGSLAAARWAELSLMEQLANIGSEFGRAARAKETTNPSRFTAAVDRCLELFDYTLADPRWHGHRRREIARARELVCDLLLGKNERNSTVEGLDRYFLSYAYAARLSRSGDPAVLVEG